MTTMADAEDAILQGQARFLEFLEEFTRQWDAPLTDTLGGVMWNGLGADGRDQMRAVRPEAAGVLDQTFGFGVDETGEIGVDQMMGGQNGEAQIRRGNQLRFQQSIEQQGAV